MSNDAQPRGAHAPKYRRLAAIGHGGMADLYVAATRGAGGATRLVALKELRPGLVRDPEFRAMFQREARVASQLSHPNVVHTYEVGSEEGRPYIAMEFLEGQPLHRILRRLQRAPGEPRGLPLAIHLRILAEVLAGLHYAHELRDLDGRWLGLVHRDVSPHNVIVTFEGQVKLVDFGIVRVFGEGDTQVGTFKGKASYSSPEQARGAEIDRRSDVFSVGVMLWEALAGARMWGELDELAVGQRLTAGEVPPLPAGAEATPALRRLCAAALAPAPADRPAGAEALREGIEAALAGQEPATPRAIGALLARAFADERAALRGVIEAQIRRARRVSEALPLLDMSGEEGPKRPGSRDTQNADEPTRPDRPSSLESTADPGVARPREEATLSGVRPLARPRPAWRWPGIVVGAAGALAAAAWVALGTGEQAAAHACARADKPEVELSGEIERAARLSCDKVYRLRFVTVVRPGASLTIEAGTTIVGDRETRGTLVVQPGATIVAEGTAERPIVFTSAAPPGERRAGDWGGLVLLGRAPTNLRDGLGRPARGRAEGLAQGGGFGGDDPEDSSGVLRHVRVEYAGVELGPNNETNGITFAGVGRGTRVDSVQVRHPLDDCFEFFGGTVDAKRLICEDPGDDGFDWDLGYTGRLQFLLVRAGESAPPTSAGLEGDNDAGGTESAPRSRPTIFNATLCGRGPEAAPEHHAVLLRRGTAATLGNALVAGFASPLEVRDRGTEVELRGALRIDAGVHAELAGRAGHLADDDAGLDEAALLRAAGAQVGDLDLPGCGGSGGRFKPLAPLLAGAAAAPADGFFDDARFAGAFRDGADAWDAGWTAWDDAPAGD